VTATREKLVRKFHTDIQEVTTRFPGHTQVFMFWSPIVYDVLPLVVIRRNLDIVVGLA